MDERINERNNQEMIQELSEERLIRREKLVKLQKEGCDPFEITRFEVNNESDNIKKNFDVLEGKEVALAGRFMSKRGMGKVSFCDLQDKSGRIQLYARKDEMDEEEYDRFCQSIDITVGNFYTSDNGKKE